MVQFCVLRIFNETNHVLRYELNGSLKPNWNYPNMSMFRQDNTWQVADRDRLVMIDAFDNFKVYKVNFLKPVHYFVDCYIPSPPDGDKIYTYIQETDPENELTLIGRLSALDYPFLIKANSSICYTIDITIYRVGNELKAEIKDVTREIPDNLKQINIGNIPGDDYSEPKEYQEGDPFTCSPVCRISGTESIPNDTPCGPPTT